MIEIKDNHIVVDGEPVAELLPTHREGTIEGAHLSSRLRGVREDIQSFHSYRSALRNLDNIFDAWLSGKHGSFDFPDSLPHLARLLKKMLADE